MKYCVPTAKDESYFRIMPDFILKTLNKMKIRVHALFLPALMALVLAIQSVYLSGHFAIFALPSIFFYCYLRNLYDLKTTKRKGLFYGFIANQEIFCLNECHEIVLSIPMKKICTVKVCNLVFNFGSVSFSERYICLFLSRDAESELNNTQGKGFYQRLHYSRGSISTEHYFLITYTPETLEILKQHLDVPVIIEDEEG